MSKSRYDRWSLTQNVLASSPRGFTGAPSERISARHVEGHISRLVLLITSRHGPLKKTQTTHHEYYGEPKVFCKVNRPEISALAEPYTINNCRKQSSYSDALTFDPAVTGASSQSDRVMRTASGLTCKEIKSL
jgi:hypothetical protein